MSKKTMAECLANGDFEEAFYRWGHTSKTWVNKWFNVCVEIFHSSLE